MARLSLFMRSLKHAAVIGFVGFAAFASDHVVAASKGTTEQEGYEWAKKMGIVDPRRCSGATSEFSRGCRNWALEQALKVDPTTNVLPSLSGAATGPDFYGNSNYSPPRFNSSQVPVFRRPWGE